MPYIFGIAGWSGAGKTTMVERLLPELVRRGYRVGTIQHDLHGGEAGRPGQGIQRHRTAGAVATVRIGPDQMLLFRQGSPPPPEELAFLLGEVDLVLAEGFRGAAWPKLEVHRGSGPLACAGDPWLMAVAGPRQPRRCPAPWYHWDEIVQIAHVIENARALGVARAVSGPAGGAGRRYPGS